MWCVAGLGSVRTRHVFRPSCVCAVRIGYDSRAQHLMTPDMQSSWVVQIMISPMPTWCRGSERHTARSREEGNE